MSRGYEAQLERSHADSVLAELQGIREAIGASGVATAGSGFVNGQLVILDPVNNPQRVKRSTADRCEALAVENPTHLQLLVGLDGDALPVTAQYRVPPYRGRMIPQPHRSISIGVDPATLGEESEPAGAQLIIYVAQFVRAYGQSTWDLVNTPAAYVTPVPVTLVANTPQTGPNLPAATLYLEAKTGNTAPVSFGVPGMNVGTDVGVMGELAAGQSVVLEVANANLLQFSSTAAAVVHVTALR